MDDFRFLYDDVTIQVFQSKYQISVIFHGNVQTTITFSTKKSFVDIVKKLGISVENLEKDDKSHENDQK